MGMKRSEKEAEIRKLLKTPGAVVQLPAQMRLDDIRDYSAEELVDVLVNAAAPDEEWDPETPDRVKIATDRDGEMWLSADGNYFAKVSFKEITALDLEHRLEVAQLVSGAYNAMKEAEEAEDDPNDPLTAGLRKLAAEEIAVLVRDAAQVTREETIRQLEAGYKSRYTRKEFVELETQMAIDCRVTDVDDVDPDALEAIRQRAEWNAQAAERAGVVWRDQDRGRPRQPKQAREQRPATSNEAWVHYCDSGMVENSRFPRWTFNAGWDYGYGAGEYVGYQAGWRARMDTLNPVCSPEAVDETLAADAITYTATHDDLQALAKIVAGQHGRISAVEDKLGSALAAIDEINRQFEVQIDMRLDLARSVESLEANLQGLLDSTSQAHSQLQRHDKRITDLEKAVDEELRSLGEKIRRRIEQSIRQMP